MTRQQYDRIATLFASGDISVAGEAVTALGEEIALREIISDRIEALGTRTDLTLAAMNQLTPLLKIVRATRG